MARSFSRVGSGFGLTLCVCSQLLLLGSIRASLERVELMEKTTCSAINAGVRSSFINSGLV
jgi:hypothetical protein